MACKRSRVRIPYGPHESYYNTKTKMGNKVFIAYKHTDEDLNQVETHITCISESLKEVNMRSFCMFSRESEICEDKYNLDEIYQFCLDEMKKCETVLFFVKNDNRSEGMEWELEKAIKYKKNIILLIQKNTKYSIFRKKIDQVIEFEDEMRIKEAVINYSFK